MLREIDVPPLWLGGALAASWALSQLWSVPLPTAGMVLAAIGVAIMVAALVQMGRARTTFVPRRDPTALVTQGLFAISRNPIYLADAVILSGAIAYWGAVLALPLIPLFMVVITRRYILDEEIRLRAGFGMEFEAWSAKVPRWIWRI